ncbi:MAG: hypothetical protein FRX49_09228 [Trebouxia sp. A1-2]|nr:MAG: hypothetical protein FRX49_09228 [Trebouxia sp. A1-2]
MTGGELGAWVRWRGSAGMCLLRLDLGLSGLGPPRGCCTPSSKSMIPPVGLAPSPAASPPASAAAAASESGLVLALSAVLGLTCESILTAAVWFGSSAGSCWAEPANTR